MEAVIIFKDGSELAVAQNGDCYITATKPEFPDDLSVVTVHGDEERVYENAYLIECASADGKYWFAFGEESQAEKQMRELREENEMLEEAIAELAEIIGGGE